MLCPYSSSDLKVRFRVLENLLRYSGNDTLDVVFGVKYLRDGVTDYS
jgi:hypothetical protein